MQLRRMAFLALSVLIGAVAVPAHAQTSAASGTVLLLPQIADIAGVSGYVTTVFVQNPNPVSITLDVTYYISDSSDSTIAGKVQPCTQLIVSANAAITFDPATQCNLISLASQNIFGSMVLAEDATSTFPTHTFFAYSRAEKPSDANPGAFNGFSVEAYPVGTFSSATADVIGLSRTSASPNYLSNCFVDALNEQVDFQIVLRDGADPTAPVLGTYPASGTATLLPYHTVRIFDVLTAVGAPAGDHSNVRATFVNTDNSAIVGFCTVETTGTGSADFRIAKSIDARDVRQARQACYGVDSCGGSVPTNPANRTYLNSTTTKNIHYAILDQPDFVQCSLVSDTPAHLADLEIMLRGPGDPQSAPQFDVAAQPSPYNNAAIYSSGGPGLGAFAIYTGEKSTVASGATTRWYIDVSFNTTTGTASDVTTPPGVPYGINCTAGNGMSVPWLGTTGPAIPPLP